MFSPRYLTLTAVILGAALSRLIPHPWNFTPVAAIALFAGAHFSNKALAFLVPFLSLLLSDMLLGWYPGVVLVYGSFLLIVGIGLNIRSRRAFGPIVLASLAGSVSFFLITNFGDWWVRKAYPLTFQGLIACYTAAIPFFRNTLAGDLFYTGLLFGGFHAMEKYIPALRPSTIAVTPSR